ncbi:MAG: sigma 54-interacting transcriptional regulator [Planctomycetota bacterium]
MTPRAQIELHFENGPRTGEAVTIDASPFLVGRDRSAQLCLDDGAVSRLHVALVERDGEWILQDLGGRNPPRIHGRPVVSVPVLDGDVIEVGGTRLRVCRVAGEGAPGVEVEIPAAQRGISPSRVQQLAGRPLWEILVRWTDLMRGLDKEGEVFDLALEGLVQVIPADRVGIYRLDPASGALVPLASRNFEGEDPIEYSETMVSRMIRSQVAKLYSPEIDADNEVRRSRSMIRKKIRNALCLPMLGRDGVWGVVYMDQVSEDRPPLLPVDLELGNLLAHWIFEALDKAERFQAMDREIVRLRQEDKEDPVLIGESKEVREIKRRIRKVAATDVTVLITGESGTGKELVAQGIHRYSPRKGEAFVAINCAAIPENLLESELFGYVAHSGIHGADPNGKPGRFELASKGTLFLDEVGELAPPLQAKLLRVLEERVVDRIGSTEPIPVDVRVVGATNRDLLGEVEAGRFREDLYYRLRVFPIDIPPLRDRPEDVLPITRHLLERHGGRADIRISPRSLEMIRNHPWPGNVRQLKNVLLEALLVGDGRTINPRDLPSLSGPDSVSFQTLSEVESRHILKVLEAVNWNKKKASEVLGIHRSTLYEKITEHRLEPPEPAELSPES